MFRRIRWKLLATYLIVVFPTLIFLGVHLSRQFEASFTRQQQSDLLDLGRLAAALTAHDLSGGAAADLQRFLPSPDVGAGLAAFVTDAAGVVVAARGEPAPAVGSRTNDHEVAEALQGRETSGAARTPGSEPVVFATVPVRAGSRVVGAVHVVRPLTYLHSQIQHLRWVVAWATVVALLMAGGVGLLLARSIAGPVQEMQSVASDLAAGKLGERVPVRTRDELGDLARSLNYMAGELERIDSLRRQFVADASHELRTPVANLAVAIEALKAVIGKDRDGATAVAGDLEREIERLRRLVDDLLDLELIEAGAVRLNLTRVQPADLLTRAVQPFQPRAAEAGVTIGTDLPARLPPVKADGERTIQILTNLLDNAIKHTPRGGRIIVTAQERRGHVLLSVADTGRGIPEAELPHIFDRFYKVDKARTGARGGAGLGLAIAKHLVEAQGGIIMVESRPGEGARFTVALPRDG